MTIHPDLFQRQIELEIDISNPPLFKFKDHSVRVIVIAGEPWWVAADVCRAIGYAVKADGSVNATQATKHLSGGEVGLCLVETHPGSNKPLTNKYKVISESGLYKLVMRSDKPEAKAFQDWVTRDVLSAIRKDGSYVMGEEKVLTGEMSEDELMARAFVAATRKLERLGAELAEVAARAHKAEAGMNRRLFFSPGRQQ